MRLKLIACDVFFREICYYVARSPHTIDLDFTELGSHAESDSLREIIQKKINTAAKSEHQYDAVLLCFGLCGNALAGIHARTTQLVLPRAHDCCTIFLGSKKAFRRHFGPNPSRPFSTVGYIERCASHLKDDGAVSCDGKPLNFAEHASVYGEENARYIFDTLRHSSNQQDTSLVFIEQPQFKRLGHREILERRAEDENRKLVTIKGSGRIIKGLVYGQWTPEDFCIVGPGQHTQGVYDGEEVVRAVPND